MREMYVCVCVCVCALARACVCVKEREREEGGRESESINSSIPSIIPTSI